ncbi:MAG: hypothetical protein ACK5L3_03800 [Oscillospiraceae bacterium]
MLRASIAIAALLVLAGCTAKPNSQSVVPGPVPAQSVVAASESEATTESEALEPAAEIKTVTAGDTIITDNYEITIKAVEMAGEAYAHGDTDMFAMHLVADEGNTFVDLTVDVKNLQKSDINSGSIMRVEVDYNGGYTYSAKDYVEDRTLGLSSMGQLAGTTIKPLETIEMRYIAQCPVEVADNTAAPLFLVLKVDNVKYQYIVR